MAKTPGWGGARQGAGRKPGPLKFPSEKAQADRTIAESSPELVQILLDLARGGRAVVEETFEPAGLQTIGNGANPRPAFPGLKDEDLVLVRKVVKTTLPDRQAAEGLLDRVFGKAAAQVDEDPNLQDEAPVNVHVYLPDNGRGTPNPEPTSRAEPA